MTVEALASVFRTNFDGSQINVILASLPDKRGEVIFTRIEMGAELQLRFKKTVMDTLKGIHDLGAVGDLRVTPY